MQQPAYQSSQYRQQDVMGASPIHLVVMAYDVAIRACEKQDFEKAIRTIGLLRDALDFDYPEVAMGLFRLYQWCMDCLCKGDYASAVNTLTELRTAWRKAEISLVSPTTVIPAQRQAQVAASA
jgi:flagellin-specific chaperone FliS